ncbi:MAG: homoserine kinase [Gudongella sp.]|nr:homoserine kinase [Gudongella sp.]
MIQINVPATSANLGAGFDTLGIALNRYNKFYIKEIEKVDFINENLVYKSYRKVFEILDKPIVEVEIIIDTDIPLSRGLGSSAACIVGGVMGANEILGNLLSKEEILEISTMIETHPDNVAPAIYGGMVTSVMEGDKVYYCQIPIKNKLEFIALVPDFKLSTKMARGVLPEIIPYKDGVFNVGRVGLLLGALTTGRDDLLKHAFKDKLHQPYRGDLIPGFNEIMDFANYSGALGCYLSGAGPTIMCISNEGNLGFKDSIKVFMENNYPGWMIYSHLVDEIGATVRAD